jgi:hypothetical protein
MVTDKCPLREAVADVDRSNVVSEWDGPAVLLPHQRLTLDKGSNLGSTPMPNTTRTEIAVIGIDIGKNTFHTVGHDKRGSIVLRQKGSRGQIEA